MSLKYCLIFAALASCAQGEKGQLEERIIRLEREMHYQKKENIEQQKTIRHLEKRIQQQEAHQQETYVPVADTSRSNTALYSQSATLSCSGGQTIFVTSAEYGEYSQTCTGSCCGPHPYDCTELMVESNTDEWLFLKLLCDNQTTCSYLFQGSTFLESCSLEAYVDYLVIYFTCTPYNVGDTVGFNAYATTNRVYNTNDLILFDGVESNFGNHFNPGSSTFLCPRDGVYLFSVTVLKTRSSKVNARLMKDSKNIIGLLADYVSDITVNLTSSNLAVIDCVTGEKIWVRSVSDNLEMNGSSSRYSSFSGILLQ